MYVFCAQDLVEVIRFIWLHCSVDRSGPNLIYLQSDLGAIAREMRPWPLRTFSQSRSSPGYRAVAADSGVEHSGKGTGLESSKTIDLNRLLQLPHLHAKTSTTYLQQTVRYLAELQYMAEEALSRQDEEEAIEIFQYVAMSSANVIRTRKHDFLPTAAPDEVARLTTVFLTAFLLPLPTPAKTSYHH